jgi:hypothetical protein
VLESGSTKFQPPLVPIRRNRLFGRLEMCTRAGQPDKSGSEFQLTIPIRIVALYQRPFARSQLAREYVNGSIARRTRANRWRSGLASGVTSDVWDELRQNQIDYIVDSNSKPYSGAVLYRNGGFTVYGTTGATR